MKCMLNGKPGFKYGESGKCYTYNPGNQKQMNEAKRKAILQGIAIGKGKLNDRSTAEKINS